MKQKRGAVGVSTLIKVISVLIVLAVFLVIVLPKFTELIFQAGERGECQWSVLVSALTRTPGLGFENIPVECKAQYINVSRDDIMKLFPEASSAMVKYRDNPIYRQNPTLAARIDRTYPKGSETNQEKLAEWSMNKFIADEMIACWDKVWRGDLPLFDVWYKMVDCGCGKRTCTASDCLKFWNVHFKRPPVFCVVCSRIKFTQDVQDYSSLKQPIDLTFWMSLNAVPKTKVSYYEYLLPDWLKGKPYNPPYRYSTKEPYAIVYQRINAHQAFALANDLASYLGLDENVPNKWDRLALVPYGAVILPFEQGGANCDYIID